MAIKTFKRGAYAPELKGKTRGKPIIDGPLPERVVLSLGDGPGDTATPIVAKGDEVKEGQKIAKAQGSWGIPIHASICGTIEEIGDVKLVNGKTGPGIVIVSNGSRETVQMKSLGSEIHTLKGKKIRDRLEDAGILGLGGAGFPAHVKLSPPKETKIDTVILNGAECEPYLTCDEKVMEECPHGIIQGLRILMQACGAQKGIVGVKAHKEGAIKALQKEASDYDNIRVVGLEDKFPQGAEKMLIASILGRKVPTGGLPLHVGVVVNNVQTALAVKEAVLDGKPLIKRVITVTGSGVVEPQDVRIPIGMLARDLLNFAGGLTEDCVKLVAGGPMMGVAQHYSDFPLGKMETGLLAMTEKESIFPPERACIRCARCLDHCPMFLNPTALAEYGENERLEEMEQWNIKDCMECGTCSYICPAKKQLLQQIILGKGVLQAAQRKK